MIHLVCTLGENVLPVLISTRILRLNNPGEDICIHTLTSTSMNFRVAQAVQRLRRVFNGDNTIEVKNPVHDTNIDSDIEKAKTKINECLNNINNGQVVLDITGGTKIMTLAAYQVALERQLDWSYVSGSQASYYYSAFDTNRTLSSVTYSLNQLSIEAKTWCKIQGGEEPSGLIIGNTTLPDWLVDHLGPNTFALPLMTDPQCIDIAVKATDSGLELYFALKTVGWELWLNNVLGSTKPRMSDYFVLRRLAKLQVQLGMDFVKTYFIYPDDIRVEAHKKMAQVLGFRVISEANFKERAFEISTFDEQNQAITDEQNQEIPGDGPIYVSLIGDEVLPTVVGFEYLRRPTNVVLVTTLQKYSLAKRVRDYLKRKYDETHITIKLTESTSYEACLSTLSDIPGNLDINLTSGSKLMALAAFERASNGGKRLYTSANKVIEL